MQFASHGQPLTSDGVRAATDELSVDATALWAVLAVETSGFGFFADRRPRILFERHYFHRLTNGRFDQSHPQISAPSSGGYVGGTLRTRSPDCTPEETRTRCGVATFGATVGVELRMLPITPPMDPPGTPPGTPPTTPVVAIAGGGASSSLIICTFFGILVGVRSSPFTMSV